MEVTKRLFVWCESWEEWISTSLRQFSSCGLLCFASSFVRLNILIVKVNNKSARKQRDLRSLSWQPCPVSASSSVWLTIALCPYKFLKPEPLRAYKKIKYTSIMTTVWPLTMLASYSSWFWLIADLLVIVYIIQAMNNKTLQYIC